MRILVIFFALGLAEAAEEEAPDVAGIPSRDLTAGEKQRYFLIGPGKDARAPKAGYRLLVVLPGSDGCESFLPFVSPFPPPQKLHRTTSNSLGLKFCFTWLWSRCRGRRKS